MSSTRKKHPDNDCSQLIEILWIRDFLTCIRIIYFSAGSNAISSTNTRIHVKLIYLFLLTVACQCGGSL